MPVAMTILSALWRFADGRGWPAKTTVRNGIGLAIALACGYVGLGLAPLTGVCVLFAWATLILGHTNWPSWWSILRYGGPTCGIALLGYLGGANPLMAILYALAGLGVGFLYVALHRYWPVRYSTAVCEATAGAAIVGGLAWLP